MLITLTNALARAAIVFDIARRTVTAAADIGRITLLIALRVETAVAVSTITHFSAVFIKSATTLAETNITFTNSLTLDKVTAVEDAASTIFATARLPVTALDTEAATALNSIRALETATTLVAVADTRFDTDFAIAIAALPETAIFFPDALAKLTLDIAATAIV